MTRLAACAAIALSLVLTQGAQAAAPGTRPASGLVEHTVKTKLKHHERLTLYLLPPEDGKINGVLCLSLLAKNPDDVRAQLLGESEHRTPSRALQFAAERNLAVVAWSAHRLWDPSRNWDELSRSAAKKADSDFDHVASAWDACINYFVKNHGLPASGYLMMGSSGAAQYAQRLALRRPERFLAIHAHIASSFDVPVKKGASLLWCVTTGENEMGYERSRKFFRAARDMRYPIIYKAYPGLGHQGNAKVTALGFACFDYALAEYERATRLNGGKPTLPDWADIFSSAPSVADIFNQAVYSKFDYLCVPIEFRMLLPEPLSSAWSDE